MLRILVWILIIYIVYKIVRIVMNALQNRGAFPDDRLPNESPIPPVSEIQDADFEDITPKSPPDPQHSKDH